MIYRMSNRERYLFYVVAVVIGSFCLNWWVVRPATAKSRALTQQINVKKREIENCIYLLNMKDAIKEETVKFSKFEKLGTSQDEEVSYFLRQIEAISKKSSVQIIDIKPYYARKAGSGTEYKVEIEIESSLNQFISFIYNLQNSEGLLRTAKFSIGPKDGNPAVLKGYLTITSVSLP